MHTDASSHDHLRITARGEPAARPTPTPLRQTAPRAGAHRSNLPIPITSLIGRGDELVAVRQCITAARLVTLIGAGGVGKGRVVRWAQSLALVGAEDGPDNELHPPGASGDPADPLSPRQR